MRCSILLLVGVTAAGGCSEERVENCKPNDHTVCKGGVVYWVDSCGEQEEEAGRCDCGCNADFTACEEPCECVPDCAGKVCGANGCAGSCPPGCGPGQTCVSGACTGECIPECVGKCCGDDQCGGTCPDACAATGQTCNAGTCLCEGACTPNCTDKECGPDGCGDDCGTCDPGYDCEAGACVCHYEVCGEVCCAEGETCVAEECCLPDCGGKQCGRNCAGDLCGLCAQGTFCSDYQCVESGVEECWSGSICPPETPYCMMSCVSGSNACCAVAPGHPTLIDGSLDDSCELCCSNPDFTHPVLWPDGGSSCCAVGSPHPFLGCGSLEKMCCPVAPASPRVCDGSTDESCQTCCIGTDYPIGVIFPDGSTACCPSEHPWPCLNAGSPGCCDDPGQCG